MQKTRNNLPVYLIMIPVLIACVLRFSLLLGFTNAKTGLVENAPNLVAMLYITCTVLIIACVLASVKHKPLSALVYFDDDKKSKNDYYMVVAVAVSFFYDFVHQAYNSYDYISSHSYIEYTYIVPLALSGVLALLCSFYFGTISLSINGSNFDFRNFTFMHLVPIVWCFLKLLLIMQRLINFKYDVDAFLELFVLMSFVAFLLSFTYSIDKQGEVKKSFVSFSYLSFAFAILLCAPRLIILIIGKDNVINSVDYSLITYIVLGIYALSLSQKALKEN